MSNQEFSDTFTTLLNSYNTVANFGEQASKNEIVLDEYEKSVLLTQAQDIIVKSYFDGTLNPQQQGFDDSTRRQVDFSSLIKVASVNANAATGGFDERSYIAQLPRRANVTSTTTKAGNTTTTTSTSTVTDSPSDGNTDVLFILNEKLLKYAEDGTTGTPTEYTIVPISYTEYDRQMSKPYSKPAKKQAWRIFQNQAVGFDVQSEIIPRDAVTSPAHYVYRVRYVRRPRPIVLENLTGTNLTVDGVSAETSCELNPSLHIDVLNKAVELAIATHGTVAQRPKEAK